ncbi:hypothetical protein RND71_028144 [Anisodus tanguticus]|uniref:Uncharacterized protein n=1 Tax=Anisodus tanguticus TaxID=243964 RepID=A0AAE1RKC2_9SOLA|nr:hypothetical protein RND71_028144 [Anisodus tanguticus]
MTTNVSESYNGLLKKAHESSVTTMVRLTFKNLVDRFDQRSSLVALLIADNKPWPLSVEKKFQEYVERAQMHTDI